MGHARRDGHHRYPSSVVWGALRRARSGRVSRFPERRGSLVSLTPGAGPLLVLAMILVAGMSLGWLVQRLRLPGVTGQVLAGVIMGRFGLHLFEEAAVEALQPLTHFALALIGVTVGAHLNLRRLRNAGRRLLLLLLAEGTLTPVITVSALLLLTDIPVTMAFLLATLAVSTAPATVVAIIRETRSRGTFVKTLLAAVAINNMVCIVLFELVRGVARQPLVAGGESILFGPEAYEALLGGLGQLGLGALLGALAAVATHLVTLRVARPERLTTLSVISIMATIGLSSYAGLSPLLSCMVLGVVQTNLNPDRDRLVDSVFANFEPAILCTFFALAGLHLSFEHAGRVGLIAAVFFAARVFAKLLSAEVAMRFARATERVRRNLGIALIPQAGVAIGLVLLIQDDPAFAPVHELFLAVVLTAVTLAEIVGPVTTRIGLTRSGEVGQDRPHLVDFIQEENIVTDLEAHSMEHEIEQLTDLLLSSHHLQQVDRESMLQSVLEREAQVSTCLGSGLAVPHGELPEGFSMVGVMGISRRGLRVETPDGLPLHCIVLLATPRGERDRHLEVLAALARTVGADSALQQELYSAKSPAHAYEVLQSERAADFNYLLEEPGDPGPR